MIRAIGYDADKSILEIEFSNGQVWHYYDFPQTLWYEFDASDSHGKFFHGMIKNQYSESRIG